MRVNKTNKHPLIWSDLSPGVSSLMIRAAAEEIDLMSLCLSHPHQAVSGSRDTGTGVNRPQLDQVERLTISFIRSHVGSMGLLPISSKFWPSTSFLVA